MNKPFTLYFFYQTGCPACKAAKPDVALFQGLHPEAIVMHCNVNTREWTLGDYTPKATPAYVVTCMGQVLDTREGKLNKAQLEKFVEIALRNAD